MPLYDLVKDLALTVERVELEQLALPLRHMTRRTTVIHLRGHGHEGVGEDVSYDEALQLVFTEDAIPVLAGEHTLESFSALVADQPGYRPWGYESAALDLALRQAGLSLADAVGREPQPVRFVVSQSAVKELLALYPELRFKLDASDKWTDAVVAELAATGAVEVVDLKGLYEGDWVDATPFGRALRPGRPRVPGGVARGRTPDGRDTTGTGASSRPAHMGLPDSLGRRCRHARVGAALPQLEAVPVRLGPQPLRLLRRLHGARDRRSTAAASSSSGRGAARSSTSPRSSIPTRRNDVAPKEYNDGGPRPGLPQSPLPPASGDPGFR